MNVIQRLASIPGGLLEEVGATTLSLDTVYGLYALLAFGAVGLWGVGVLAFGRCRGRRGAEPRTSIADRATPVAP